MDNNKFNVDNKENLGHGIKGETNMDANNMKNENENKKKLNNNK